MSASGAMWIHDECGVCSVLGTFQEGSSSMNLRSFQADREHRELISVDHGPEGKVESTKCLLGVEDEFLKPGLDITLVQSEEMGNMSWLMLPPHPERKVPLTRFNEEQWETEGLLKHGWGEQSSLFCWEGGLHSDRLSQDHNRVPPLKGMAKPLSY